MAGFDELGLSAPVLRGLKDMGFEEPTPVQARTIPLLLEGRDVVAQALTGTGKTAAYGIPLIERSEARTHHTQAIVLVPTRELAIQVSDHLSSLGRNTNLRFLPIYGGQPIERQLRALSRGVHVIVATPGRLMDHMRRRTVDLSFIKMLVLDEADQMLQMGFQEDVEYVVGNLASERVTALFSATMPKPILQIVNNYMRDPETILLSKPQSLTVPATTQVYYVLPFPRKLDGLVRVLDARLPDRSIVFCSTKRMVDEVAERLSARGYSAEAIHGDITQSGRERVLQAFRQGRIDILVATDVAARGLDIPEVSLIVNFDIPPDPEYYVHRIGRTSRLGRAGEAITFVNPREIRELELIQRVTGAPIRRAELPTLADAEEREAQQLEERLLDVLERGSWRGFLGVAEELATDRDPLEVAAAALALANEGRSRPRTTRLSSIDDAQPPRSVGERRPRPPTRRRNDGATARSTSTRGIRAKGLKAQKRSRR